MDTPVFQAVIVLCVVGFLLLGAEVFVPGLILGSLGAMCLMVAIGLGYYQYGWIIGSLMLAGVGLLGIVGFFTWLSLFPRTSAGRRLINSTSGSNDFLKARHPLLGKSGAAFSALRPAGIAMIEGRKVDVIAEGSFIERGTDIDVILVEGPRVVVRKKLS